MRVESVAESFATYRAAVLPPDASAVQVIECQRAFTAGVYFLLMGALRAIGDESTPEDDGIAQLEAIKAECEAFATAPPDPNAAAFASLEAMRRAAAAAGVPLEPPMMAARRMMREAEQAAGPLPPDVQHTAPTDLVARIRPLLERLGHHIGGDLPDGWGFALFLFSFGAGGHTFYISNGDRADVLTALHEYIRRQTS